MSVWLTILVIVVCFGVSILMVLPKSKYKDSESNSDSLHDEPPNVGRSLVNQPPLNNGEITNDKRSTEVLRDTENLIVTRGIKNGKSSRTLSIIVKTRHLTKPLPDNIFKLKLSAVKPKSINIGLITFKLLQLPQQLDESVVFCGIDEDAIHIIGQDSNIIINKFKYNRPLVHTDDVDKLVEVFKNKTLIIESPYGLENERLVNCISRLHAISASNTVTLTVSSTRFEYGILIHGKPSEKHIPSLFTTANIEGLERHVIGNVESTAKTLLDVAKFIVRNRSPIIVYDTFTGQCIPIHNTRYEAFRSLPEGYPVNVSWRYFYADGKEIAATAKVIDEYFDSSILEYYRFRVRHQPHSYIEAFVPETEDERIEIDDKTTCRNKGMPRVLINQYAESGVPKKPKSITFEISPDQVDPFLDVGDLLTFKDTDLTKLQFNKTIRLEFLKSGSRAFTTVSLNQSVLKAVNLAHYYDYTMTLKSLEGRFKLQVHPK